MLARQRATPAVTSNPRATTSSGSPTTGQKRGHSVRELLRMILYRRAKRAIKHAFRQALWLSFAQP